MEELTRHATFLYHAKKAETRIKEMQISGKQTKDWGERSGLEKDHEFMFYRKLQIKGPLKVDSKLRHVYLACTVPMC